MADIELIKGADNGNQPDTLRQMYPKVNRNFDKLNQEIADHKVSTSAHTAQDITYSGDASGTNVKEAIEGVNVRIGEIIQGGGPDKDGELVDIRTPDPSYTPTRTVTVAGDIVRDMQEQFGTKLSLKTSKRRFDVKDYGAKGDGVTDDIAAIDAAIAAASAVYGVVYFPSSGTTYRISSPITVTPSFSIEAEGIATIEGIGDSDGIVFTSGNYGSATHRLPSITNFVHGTGLRLKGASLVFATIPTVANCKSGIMLETGEGYPQCLDNTITGSAVHSCKDFSGGGLHVKCVNSTDIMQGNIIRFNFFNANANSIYFDKPTGVEPNWDDQLIEIDALEGFGVSGSCGIYAPNGMPNARTLIRCRTFFGGFDGKYIDYAGNNNTFELAFVDHPAYEKVNFTGVGNRVLNYGAAYSHPIISDPIMAVTSSNSRSSFNLGNPTYANKMFIGLSITNLSAGQGMDFYVYSPLTTGYSHMLSFTPHFNQPIAVMCIEDTSVKPGIDGLSAPNQIHIKIVALANVAASLQTLTVEVGL